MTASQETDRAHRAETPCGDLRPFAENVGGDAGVLRGCVRVLFFLRIYPEGGRRCVFAGVRICSQGGGSEISTDAACSAEEHRRLHVSVRGPNGCSGARGRMKTHWR